MSTESVYMTIEQIQEKIPHRFPFLLIDRVLSFKPGEKPGSLVGRELIARKNVSFNEPYFAGHFPHRPVMPGVLQIEAMAQAGALAATVENDVPMDVLFAKIDGARFRRQVVPGDVLEIKAVIKKVKSGMLGVDCEISCDGERVAEVGILAKVFPREDLT